MKFALRYAVLCLVIPCFSLDAARAQPDSKNSKEIVKIFRDVVSRPSRSTVRVCSDSKEVALGTVVHKDGWIITKASELTGKLTTVRFANGVELFADIKGIHEPYDLAMLKIKAGDSLKPVKWQDSKAATVGRWVASAGTGEDPVAIGVISVATRPFKQGDQPPKQLNSNSGFLGVNLDAGEGGAKIVGFFKGGPAEKAGLKLNDIVTHVGKRRILDTESLINAVGRHKPGEDIEMTIIRDKEELKIKATLAKRPPQLLGNPQDRMGSELSNRRGGFPSILQHDTVLKPAECGGPLVDLDGRVVGINIARAGRVETYAVPAEVVLQLIPDLMSGKLAPTKEKD
jgi:serine protease Do